MCNPLLDISAEVGTELLTKYNVSLNNAILAADEHLPLYQELVEKYPVQYIVCTKLSRSASFIQLLTHTIIRLVVQHKTLLELLNGCYKYLVPPRILALSVTQSLSHSLAQSLTHSFTYAGCDKYGEQLEKCAQDDGVDVCYQKNPSVPTGTCAVLVNGGERSLVANLAAANTFSAAHLESSQAKELISKAKVYYISGFFLTVSVESILKIAKESVENNKTFCMNLSAPFLIQFFGDQMSAVMPYADFVFGNESEAEAYGI